jgi:hypothetical protein
LLFLFSIFISFVLSQYSEGDAIQFKEGDVFRGSGTKSYKILNAGSTNNYLHIKIESQSKNNQMVLISQDNQCKNNRKSLGIQAHGTIHLFLTKEEVSNIKNNFFICLECQYEQECSYKIHFKSENELELYLGEQTSYYVNSSNKKMSFKFTENNQNNLRNLDTMYLNGNIWVKGMNIQNINLKTSDDLDLPHKSFNFGYIFPFQRIDSSSLKLDIESTEGEYITIGSLSLDENSISRNEIKVNDLEIMGILSGRSKEICFNLEDIDDITAQINGIIFTQKAKTYFIHEDKQVLTRKLEMALSLSMLC